MAAVEDPLRDQVRLLGQILGETVAELHGPAALELVEGTRRAAVALRQGNLPGGRDAFAASMAAHSQEELELLAAAFTDFFHLINAAEEQHRIRVLRARDRPGSPPEGSIAAAVREMRSAGATAGDVQSLLDRLLVMPVLTAHPTEARRRTVIDHAAQVSAALDRLDDPRLGARERQRLLEELRAAIAALACTSKSRTARPTPIDEIRAGLQVFERTLLDVVPEVYRELEDALGASWPEARFRVGPFLRFGSWIGGDRDGNPFVTAEVTRAALERQRTLALRRLSADASALWRALSASVSAAPPEVAADLRASIEADRARFEGGAAPFRTLHAAELWREKLAFAAARLEAARLRAEGAYPDASAYLADLHLLDRTLRAAGLGRLADGPLRDARRRAEVFGFHLATLDLRQHSEVHERAVAEILGQGGTAGYLDLPDERRIALLADLLGRAALAGAERARLSPEAREAVEALEVVGRARRDTGPEACERYVVSFTHSASDLLEVLFLARAARLAPDEIRPVPLLEQLEDLDAAGSLAQRVLSLGPLRAALGGELEVMIGYSDSGKQVGYVASQVALRRAQLALAREADAAGVVLTVFHGRGGAVGRGGGPANRAIRSQPRAALRGRFRLTEQGETVAARYGRTEIARRDLEQMVNAVLVASAGSPGSAEEDLPEERERAIESASAAALAAYRRLTGDPVRLTRYALAATPMEEVPELRFASRPASRSGRPGLEALRAIPWVFSWNQSRHGIPGWFGLGAALEAIAAADGLPQAQALYREWPFLRGMVDNARLALTQADIEVASHYARLAAPEDRVVFDLIREEHVRTVSAILAVTGDATLMAPFPAVGDAAARRDPYVDVLSHLQVELLARLRRSPGPEKDRLREALLLTVNGIAAGLQTLG
jgi:phosphoenolpyruvate carboxylase